MLSMRSNPASVPVAYGAWPTLGSMIAANTRLVSFIASQADYSSAYTFMLKCTLGELLRYRCAISTGRVHHDMGDAV